MFQIATKESLSLGGGGSGYALWLDRSPQLSDPLTL
jgi:hypothetical protein